MIEAQIICCEKCEIPDLGLAMMPGEEQWVSEAVARNSKDLRRVQGMGKVRVYRKARQMPRNPKRPPPPFVARSRPQVVDRGEPKVVEVEKVVEKVVEVERVEVVKQEVDTEKLKAELLGDLLPGLRAVVAEEMSKAVAQAAPAPAQEVPAPAPSVDPEQLESVLERVVRRVVPAGGAVPGTAAARASGPEEPLFIPGNIVDKDAKAKIDVKSKATEGTDDLDDAQAALREIKRKRRAKKDGNEEKP